MLKRLFQCNPAQHAASAAQSPNVQTPNTQTTNTQTPSAGSPKTSVTSAASGTPAASGVSSVTRRSGRYLRYDTGHGTGKKVSAPHVQGSDILRLPDPTELSSEAVEEMAYRYGRYYDSYLVTEPGRHLFVSRGKQGLVSYTQVGKHVLVGGGLIAPQDHKPELLREFSEFTADNKLKTMFFNVDDEELPLYRQQGFQATKWGEEPVLDLGSVTWSGGDYEWVRRQANFCKRNGLKAYEVRLDDMTARQWSRTFGELLEIASECMQTKPQAEEMRFFEGRIDTHSLGLRRLFIARGDDGLGRIEGFVVCTPMQNGTMWATEMYRHRLDGVRGTVAYLIHHLVNQLQKEGVQRVSLCLVPALRCETPMEGDSPLVRYGMQLCNRLPFLMDLAGMHHFKSRFRPRYENRYVCASPKAGLGSVFAFLRVFGALNVHVGKFTRITFDQARKRLARRTLAKAS